MSELRPKMYVDDIISLGTSQLNLTPSNPKQQTNQLQPRDKITNSSSSYGNSAKKMVRQHGSLEKDEETNQAAWEAARGALVGGTKWGAFFAVAGGVAYAFSPLYRGLTVQFKTYIQMSGMILGGMLEADKRMVSYQHRIRHHKRLARDMEIWRRYEDTYEERGTPGVGAESDVHGPDGKSA